MPSRRLPRSDGQRSAALQTCQTQYQSTTGPLRLISEDQFTQLTDLKTPWEAARGALNTLMAAQAKSTTLCNTRFNVCARACSHFIQVLNLGIDRGRIPAGARAYYELPVSQSSLPDLSTSEAVLTCAEKLAKGEARRIAADGAPLAWPDIGEVTDAATALEAQEKVQSAAKKAVDLGQEAVAAQRPAVNALIRDLWDTIEFQLRRNAAPSLRRKARQWGVFYRGSEKTEPPANPAGG